MNSCSLYLYQVTLPFLEYVKTRGFMIEVFGHYEQHPLHFESDTVPPVKSPAPSRSGLTVPYQKLSSAQSVAKYDVIMNLQICELNPEGDYVPVPVTYEKETNESSFILQQCLQKRIILSFVYDSILKPKIKKVSVDRLGPMYVYGVKCQNSSEEKIQYNSENYLYL